MAHWRQIADHRLDNPQGKQEPLVVKDDDDRSVGQFGGEQAH